MSAPDELNELGRRIRKVRIERRMTLKQVEAVSGLSATHLSEIERARTSPTLGALIRIARSLRKEPAFFLEGEELDDVAHTRREETRTLDVSGGAVAEVLTPGIPGSEICAYRLKLDPSRSDQLNISPQEVTGDVIYIAVRGSVEAKIGDEQIVMSEGDAIHASLTLPHVVKPASTEVVEMIVISTKPLDGTSRPTAEEQ